MDAVYRFQSRALRRSTAPRLRERRIERGGGSDHFGAKRMRRRRGRDARKEHAMASEGAGERDRDDADAPSGAHASPARRSWSQVLAPYAQPRAARSALDLATSLVPYLALSALAYAT